MSADSAVAGLLSPSPCAVPYCTSGPYAAGLRVCPAHLKHELGVTYRQLDHWVRQGYLRPAGGDGSGSPRSWPPAELDIVRRMSALISSGLTVAAAAVVARGGWPGAVPLAGHPATASQGWLAHARCAETDPELFFPEKGASTRPAKRICGGCEVRAECLDYALEHHERNGVWGGMSARQREREQLARLRGDGAA